MYSGLNTSPEIRGDLGFRQEGQVRVTAAKGERVGLEVDAALECTGGQVGAVYARGNKMWRGCLMSNLAGPAGLDAHQMPLEVV